MAWDKLSSTNYKRPISLWLSDGGRYEDKPPLTFPYVRSFNHFHNPLEPLADAGYGIGASAALWSQKPPGTQWPGGYYSWHDAREYYLNGLRASNKTIRDYYLAETFRSLGQVMHLVQDMSVPEHARNDGHLLPAYEEWVAIKPEGIALTVSALVNPIPFEMSALRQPSPFSETNVDVPIARLFDSQRYDGTNPAVTVTANIGLAEYTNANFLTGDTLFTSTFSKKFPYPAKTTSVRAEDRDIPDPLNAGSTVKRPYHIKVADGETGLDGTGYLLAGVDYFHFYREQEPESAYTEVEIVPPMDDYVFADYARLLLPRAVGYSATLLHYFFRAQIGMEPSPDNPREYLIRNDSDEEMSGTFGLYYDDIYGNRYRLASWNLTIPAHGTSAPVGFVWPDDPEEAGKFILVFEGTLGAEENDAVAGKVLTLPRIGWWEEWDKGLAGNHPWLTTGIELTGFNAANGQTVNLVAEGMLNKENIRYAGNRAARVNQNLIMDAYQSPWGTYCIDEWFSTCFPNDFGMEFPLSIARST